MKHFGRTTEITRSKGNSDGGENFFTTRTFDGPAPVISVPPSNNLRHFPVTAGVMRSCQDPSPRNYFERMR